MSTTTTPNATLASYDSVRGAHLRRIILMVTVVIIWVAGFAFIGATQANATPTPDSTSQLSGDDNHDGRIDEDESGWNCATMGNKSCGPWIQFGVVEPPKCAPFPYVMFGNVFVWLPSLETGAECLA